MTVRVKSAEKTEIGSAAWIALLAKCVDSIGTETFTDNLALFLRSVVDVDHVEAFAYHQNERPICLFHYFDARNQAIFVDDYLKGPYLLDPFYKACMRRIDTGLYRLRDIAPDRFLQSEYYRSYYIQTGLAEEICYTFYLPNDVAAVISLMRSGEHARFSAREFRILDSLTPIIVSLAQRQWQDVSNEFAPGGSKKSPKPEHIDIEERVSDMFSRRLTPRETQVVAQVLEGHSSDSISKNLGITVGTVRIHRRNIYSKLHISSQQELCAIFFKNVTAKH